MCDQRLRVFSEPSACASSTGNTGARDTHVGGVGFMAAFAMLTRLPFKPSCTRREADNLTMTSLADRSMIYDGGFGGAGAEIAFSLVLTLQRHSRGEWNVDD